MASSVAAPASGNMPFGAMASGVMAALEEEDSTLKVHALRKLHRLVDQCWAEIADAVPQIESLAEDDQFPERELAAAVAAKVFYHLEEYDDALRVALRSGAYFDTQDGSDYSQRLLELCVDKFTAHNRAAYFGEQEGQLDQRLVSIVDDLFERCFAQNQFSQALGIALESHRLDKMRDVVAHCPDQPRLLSQCLSLAKTMIASKRFRTDVLRVLIELYRELPEPDVLSVAQCLLFLDDSQGVAELVNGLIQGSPTQSLLAFQVAFDLAESDNQRFLLAVHARLPTHPDEGAGSVEEGGVAQEEKKEAEEGKEGEAGSGEAEGSDAAAAASAAAEAGGEEVGQLPAPGPDVGEPYWSRLKLLKPAITGETSMRIFLHFLCAENRSDQLLMRKIRDGVDPRTSVLHQAVVTAHGFMNCGTTSDVFLRDNLEWLGRATNWNTFSATASLGVIYKGHLSGSMKVLDTYLPPENGVSSSVYSESGALYALGLIHTARGSAAGATVTTYLRNALRSSSNPVMQHGACLGLGLAGMSNGDLAVYEEVKNVMFQDDADAGEAAALALGMLLLGSGTSTPVSASAVQEMLGYAEDTRHDKIVRGIAVGLALIMSGKEEGADVVIEQLLREKNPILRYGAMFTIALAYAGTGNNGAVKRLLHVAVSDASDDVRRAAVVALGFVQFRRHDSVPRTVALLAESFNPHVRYGAAMAVGIACAGTAQRNAVELLKPMLADKVDFVRQSAFIAMAMVLMQQSEGRVPYVKEFRDKVQASLADKHQAVMARMGCVMAHGILEAGGRNCTVALQSQSGFARPSSLAGMALFLQYWYWLPMSHMISLAFAPTAVIGLNKDLKLPTRFNMHCNAPPSAFAYPEPLKEDTEEKKELVATVELSTTARNKAREAAKQKEKDGEAGAEEAKAPAAAAGAGAGASAGGGMEEEEDGEEDGEEDKGKEDKGKEGKEEKNKEEEPRTHDVSNPSRVTRQMAAVLSFDPAQRYQPVRSLGAAAHAAAVELRTEAVVFGATEVPRVAPGAMLQTGIIMLADSQEGEEDPDLREPDVPETGIADKEPSAPEPFIWTPPQ